MKPLATDLGMFVPPEVEEIRNYMREMEERLGRRRVHNELPSGWPRHTFEQFSSKSRILLTVDEHTSGRFAYLRVRRGTNLTFADYYNIIAFEDPEDMTMFLLAYDPVKIVDRTRTS